MTARCRLCGAEMVGTGRFLGEGAGFGRQGWQGRNEIMRCRRCGWLWWLAAEKEEHPPATGGV